ncbi:CxxH/CxxC protein [Bacillus xiapuensis]|uniref:CxxH/CxxC protein n=1 Tax=Bacillus xiapuensis TaxID=2014075 RepID=UPI000C23903E|nr:CxxH/CxxC protein [Bacillus xiapuensis]
MIYCCNDHVELALDVIVDEYETFPVLRKLKEEEKMSTACEYCRKEAEYMVEN